jgi:uncharacterized membrane protein
MTSELQTVLLVAGAAFSFSSASLIFTVFSREISATWMNAMKAAVCLLATLFICAMTGLISWPQLSVMSSLVISGFVGLGVGDYFLLEAYVKIGSARTILLFSFQPIFLGFAGWLLFNEQVTFRQLIAIIFLIGCLVSFALEKRKESGHWHLQGLLFAVVAVLLDNTGILFTRWGLSHDTSLNPLWANFFRCIGAIIFFAGMQVFFPFGWFKHFVGLSTKRKVSVILASLIGTTLSLGFYLSALRQGHLAMIGALGGLAPLMSAVLESVFERKWPSRYFVVAFLCFSLGLGIFLKFDNLVF